jgi:hypothetical protein
MKPLRGRFPVSSTLTADLSLLSSIAPGSICASSARQDLSRRMARRARLRIVVRDGISFRSSAQREWGRAATVFAWVVPHIGSAARVGWRWNREVSDGSRTGAPICCDFGCGGLVVRNLTISATRGWSFWSVRHCCAREFCALWLEERGGEAAKEKASLSRTTGRPESQVGLN